MFDSKLYEECLNNINAYVVLVGKEGEVHYANRKVLELFKEDQETIHFKQFYKMLKDSDTTSRTVDFLLSFQKLTHPPQDDYFLETVHTLKQGLITILWSGKELQDFFLYTGYDISILKVIEDELRTSFEKYKVIFNNTSDAMYLIRFDSNKSSSIFHDINNIACEQTGFTYEEIILQEPEHFFEASFTNQFYSGGFSSNVLLTHQKRKDGTYFPVRIISKRIKIQKEEFLLVLVQDITREKKEFDLLQTLMESLESEIYNYLLLIDQIRNPLAIISALSELEKTKNSERIIKNVDKINDVVAKIDHSLEKTEKLRKEILDFIKEYFE